MKWILTKEQLPKFEPTEDFPMGVPLLTFLCVLDIGDGYTLRVCNVWNNKMMGVDSDTIEFKDGNKVVDVVAYMELPELPEEYR